MIIFASQIRQPEKQSMTKSILSSIEQWIWVSEHVHTFSNFAYAPWGGVVPWRIQYASKPRRARCENTQITQDMQDVASGWPASLHNEN
jgi:hypothetical protein